MNEEALKTVYDLSVEEGYGGTIEDFKVLMNSNEEAFKTMFDVSVGEGYSGSIDDFSLLLGVKKKEPSNTQSPEGGSGSSVDSQSQSLSPSEGKKTFLGFDIEAAKSQYNDLPPTKKRIVDLTIEKAQLEKKVRINPWSNDVLRLDEVGKQIERLSAVAQTDEYLVTNNVNLDDFVAPTVRTEAMRQVVEGGGVAPSVTPEQQALNATKAAKELMVVDLYMNHLKKTDPARYNEEVELLPMYKDAVTATGNQGLVEWVNRNKPAGENGSSFISTFLFGTSESPTLLQSIYEPYTRNDAEARAFRIVNEADAFFTNYLNQKAVEVVEAQDALPDDAKTALKGIGDTTTKLNDITAKITALQEANPKVFGATRRASIEALESMQADLAAKKVKVEEVFSRLQANDADMALSEQYTRLAQEYNQMVNDYNLAADNAKVSGEAAIIGEYNSLIEDYKALSANIEEAMGKVGSEFWASLEAYNKVEGIAEQHSKDVMDKPFDWSAWRESMKQRDLLQREIDVMAGVARGDLGAYVNEVIVRPILEPILETSKGALVGVPNTVADLILGDDRGSDALNRLYNGIESAPNSVNMLPVLKEAGLFGNERVPAWMSAPAAISQGFSSVATFATAGGATAGVARGAAMTAKAVNTAQKVAVAATATTMMTDGLYREALDAGIPRRDAAAISLAMAGILGYTETLVNDADLFAPVSSRFRQSVFRELAQNYASGKGFTRGMLSKQMTNVLKGLDEFGEEATAAIVEGVLKGAVNMTYGQDYFELPDAKDILEQGLIGAFTGFGAGAIGQLASSSHPSNINTFIEVVNDPARLADAMDYLRPRMTNEQFAEFNSLVTAYQGVFTGVDVDGLGDDVKARVADGLVRIGLMEQEIKAAKDKDIAEQMMRPKIEALRGQVMGLLSEREATVAESAPVEVDPMEQERVAAEAAENEAFVRELEQTNADGSNPELVDAVDKILRVEQQADEEVQMPVENQPEVVSPALENVDAQEDQRFTNGERLNKITESARLKYGAKVANPIIDVALRLVNPNQNNIVEIRTNGVVVKEGGDFFFKPFNNTDSAKKNWGLGSAINVNDQYQWRLLFNKESDVFKKSAMLRSLSDVSKSDKELSDVVSLLTEDIPEQANIAWSVMRNPNSSIETFDRAAKNRELSSSTNIETIMSLREDRFGFRNDVKDAVNKFGISDVNTLSEKSSPLFALGEQELSDLYDADPDEISVEKNAQRIELRRLARKPSSLVIPDLLAKFKSIPKEQRTENWDVVFGARKNSILEAYYKAKSDGSNPELVNAVENLIQSSETTPTQPIAREQGGQAQSAVAEETRPAPQERGVDGAEAATAEGTTAGDTAVAGSTPTVADRYLKFIDDSLEKLDSFGKSTAGINLPVPIAKAILKTARASIVAGKTVAEAINDAIEKLRSYKWFNNRTDEQKTDLENAVRGSLERGEKLPVSATPAVKKRFKELREKVNTELAKTLASSDAFERLQLGRISQMALGVVGKMDGDVINAFVDAMEELQARRADMPLDNYVAEMDALIGAFADEYNDTYAETLGRETDTEDVKRKKYQDAVELAALEIEEAVANINEKYGDFATLVNAIKEAYGVAVIPQDRAATEEANTNVAIESVMQGYVADALAILTDATAEDILAAAEQVYGYAFKQTMGLDFSSSRIARELMDAAVILQALAQGEKLPSNLQALQTPAALVTVLKKKQDLVENYGKSKQRELFASVIGSVISIFSNRTQAEADAVRRYADFMKARSERASVVANGNRFLFGNVISVDTGRLISNNIVSAKRTELNGILSRILFQRNSRKPSNISARIVRKLDMGKAMALHTAVQANGITQEVASVLAGFYFFERQLDENGDFYRSKGGEMKAVIDAWMRHNQRLKEEGAYRVRIPFVGIDDDLGMRTNEEFYLPVYTWLNENGYYNEDGRLDWGRLYRDMGQAEKELIEYIDDNFDALNPMVALFSNAARNEDIKMFDAYMPLAEGLAGGGSTMSAMNTTPSEQMEAATRPLNATGNDFVVEGTERVLGSPTKPSAYNARVSQTFNRPIVLSISTLFNGYNRSVYRDIHITPAAQRAQKELAFMAAITQNDGAKVHNLASVDTRMVGNMVADVYNPRTYEEQPEDKQTNRVVSVFSRELMLTAMSSFLMGSLGVGKAVVELAALTVTATARHGIGVLRGFYDNNLSSDAKMYEAFIEEAGLGILGTLGSESANIAYAGSASGLRPTHNTGRSRFGLLGGLRGAFNSVESKAGMRNFFNQLFKNVGLATIRRKSIGAMSAILTFPEIAISPSVAMSTIRRAHKELTGREFDVREYIDEKTMLMKPLSGEQRALMLELKKRADRATSELSVEADPAGQAGITRKIGKSPASALFLTVVFPFMSWPYNNTMQFLKSFSGVATLGGYKYSDRENLVLGANLGEGRGGTFVSGLSDMAARTIAGAVYIAGASYVWSMLSAVLFKALQEVFPEAPDEEYDTLEEIVSREHDLQIGNIERALPNIVLRSLKEQAMDGVPIVNAIPVWDMVGGEGNVAPIPFTEEDLKYNRLLRLTQATIFKDRQEEEQATMLREIYNRMSPQEIGRSMGEAPVWEFLNVSDYYIAYLAADDAMREVYEMSDIPTGERFAMVSTIAGVMLKMPIMTTYRKLEMENMKKGNERMKQIMKSNEFKQVVKEVEKKVSDEKMQQETK